MSGCWLQCISSDFSSVVLIRTLPGALNRLILPVTSLFSRTLCGVYYYGLASSSIHSKIISAATIRILELTRIAKIEFFPLDWIYRSIRIMMVLLSAHCLLVIWYLQSSKLLVKYLGKLYCLIACCTGTYCMGILPSLRNQTSAHPLKLGKKC